MNPSLTSSSDRQSGDERAVAPALRQRLDARLRAARAAIGEATMIPPRDPESAPRLSLAEEHLWYLEQFVGGTATYTICRAWRVRGPIDRTALHTSVDELVRRHPALRTTFARTDNDAIRTVHAKADADWHWHDCTRLEAPTRPEELARILRTEAITPFDLTAGPLARFSLITFAPDEHVFVIALHHIIADGWSLGLMLRELGADYEARISGVTLNRERPSRDYADFAAWQRSQARSGAFEGSIRYWEESLRGAPAMLELPPDRPRPAVPSYRGELAHARLGAERIRDLAALGKAERASLFVVLLTVYLILLHRHSGQDDIVIGSPFAGRTQSALDRVVGYFANMLPLRMRVSGDLSFRELLRQTRDCVLAAADRQDAPFAMIVERLRPPLRHAGVNPVFQATFVLEEARLVGLPEFAGTTTEMVPLDTGTSKFDISLLIIEGEAGLEFTMEACADVFDTATPERLMRHYMHLLSAILNEPDVSVGVVPLQSEAARAAILHQGHGPRGNFPRDGTVHELFAEIARRRPHAAALATGDRSVTYGSLHYSATLLARHLRARGVHPGDHVAIVADRSIAFVTALLATLNAGAAYVPLDARHPAAWLRSMLDQVRPAAILVAPQFRHLIPATAVPILTLEEDPTGLPDPADERPDAGVSIGPESSAYVMFTSGSTGRPKGTVVPHRAIIRLVRGTNYANLGPDEVHLLLANLAFDASTFEIWGALLNGACLAIPDSPQPTLTGIGEAIRLHGVTTLWLTTGLFNAMIDACPEDLAGVRQVLTGGEALSAAHAAKALAMLPRTRLINLYGPTENTVFSTSHLIGPEHARGHGIPIGRPIAATSVYILDLRQQPVPVGVPGELYTGGDGVASGYLNQPELTATRFLQDPFHGLPGVRMYRTGDRCRWREDGSIEFLGRIDQEIKIRGFRVDLGEVEAAATSIPGVVATAVLASGAPGSGRERELIACIVPDDEASLAEAQLRELMARRLPPHMVPSTFIIVPSLPLTDNGKVDRRVLESLVQGHRPTGGRAEPMAPRTDTEHKLAELWCALLRCDSVGIDQSFFDLGGHSLLAMRLMHSIERLFGRTLPLSALLATPTIAGLSARLGTEPGAASTAQPGALRGHGPGAPLFFIPGLGGYEFLPPPVARELEGIAPFFDGLQIPGVDGHSEPLEDVRAIAAHLVNQIRQVCPQGPYNICGYCYGGVVAFEVARQLETAGEVVSALIIWHGYPVAPVWPRRELPDMLRAIATRIEETPARQRPRMLWDKARLAVRMFGWRLSDEWNHLLGRPRSLIPHNVFFPEHMEPRVVYANLRARARYEPAPYRGRVFLLFGETDRLIRRCPPLAGWDGLLLGPVEIFVHPVEHMVLVVPPALDLLAGQTAACLEAVSSGTRAGATHGFTAVPSLDTHVRRSS